MPADYCLHHHRQQSCYCLSSTLMQTLCEVTVYEFPVRWASSIFFYFTGFPLQNFISFHIYSKHFQAFPFQSLRTMAEEVDYEEEIDMSEETLKVPAAAQPAGKGPAPAASSGRTVTIKTKGRGHDKVEEVEDHYEGRGGVFEKVKADGSGSGPLQSIEGWIVFAKNLHEEVQEEDVLDKFAEFGTVKNIHLNLDRRTGYAKGYCLVEFEEYDDALSAIKGLDGQDLVGQKLTVDWAFIKK